MSDVNAATIDALCVRLLQAHAELARRSTRDIIGAIDAAAALLGHPDEPEREAVLRSLVDVSGFSRAMAEHTLDRVRRDWSAPALDRLVRAELGGPEALDGFMRAGGRTAMALGPRLSLHVFSGNVPGVGVTSIVRALLVRSAVLGKSAAGEPALAPAFVRLLRRVDAGIGAAVESVYWPGGSREIEDAALRHADLVVHYGSAAALDDMRARIGGRIPLVEHGPKLSFALVNGAALDDDERRIGVARDLARAVALFDQQGCVSPQVAWVTGSRAHTRVTNALADDLARALDEVERELPRGRLAPGEAAAIRELRTRAEFAGDELRTGDALTWSVVVTEDDARAASCLNRTLIIRPAADLDAVLNALAPLRPLLQTAGLAGFGDDEREPVARRLAAAGVTRITSVADMPWPPPEWHHDGRGPLVELIRWVDLEGPPRAPAHG